MQMCRFLQRSVADLVREAETSLTWRPPRSDTRGADGHPDSIPRCPAHLCSQSDELHLKLHCVLWNTFLAFHA